MPRRSLSAAQSLSLPDLAVIERRTTSYATSWQQQVDGHEEAQHHSAKMAKRLQHEAEVVASSHERLTRPRADAARQLLSTPLPATITPEQYESFAAGQREALHYMQKDCLRREEVARRCHLASREATLAADRAETLEFLRAEALFRVSSHRSQLEEAMQRRRALEQKRLQVDRVAELAARAKEKAAREAQRRAREAELAQTVAERRAGKEEAEKRQREEAKAAAEARAEAARRKAELKAARKAHVARQASGEFAKRLEKAAKHAGVQATRAEEAFNEHVRPVPSPAP